MSSTTEISTAAHHRRSIRKYTADPITDAQLADLLVTAGRAPSAWNLQPWHIIAVRDAETKLKLQEVAYGQTQVGSAPVVLVLVSDLNDRLTKLDEALGNHLPEEIKTSVVGQVNGAFGSLPTEHQNAWGKGQTYILLGYLLLAAEGLGLGTSPMLGFDPNAVKSILGLDPKVEIAALVSVGHPAEDGFESYRLPAEVLFSVR